MLEASRQAHELLRTKTEEAGKEYIEIFKQYKEQVESLVNAIGSTSIAGEYKITSEEENRQRSGDRETSFRTQEEFRTPLLTLQRLARSHQTAG